MVRLKHLGLIFTGITALSLSQIVYGALRDTGASDVAPNSGTADLDANPDVVTDQPADSIAESDELLKAKESMKPAAETPKKAKAGAHRAEAFIAGADWEFDGFVAGGQDQQVKSMFATNDLVYLNIGTEQGMTPGLRLGIYRRGERVRDPQSGRVLGFEVRKMGIVEVTDRLDGQTCSSRVIHSYEALEVGDLVRKE